MSDERHRVGDPNDVLALQVLPSSARPIMEGRMPRPSPGRMRQTRKRSQDSARVGPRPGGPAAAGTWPRLRLPPAFKFFTRAGLRVIPLSHVSRTLLLARDLDGDAVCLRPDGPGRVDRDKCRDLSV
jgi:hypothetical protein